MKSRLMIKVGALTFCLLGLAPTASPQSFAPGTEYAASLSGILASVTGLAGITCENQSLRGDSKSEQLFPNPSSKRLRVAVLGNRSFGGCSPITHELVSKGVRCPVGYGWQTLPAAQGGTRRPGGSAGLRIDSPRQFVGDVLHDQVGAWKFPLQVAHGHHWKPVLAFTLATAGIVELDPHDTPYFRRTQSFAGFNRSFSSMKTGLGEGLFPVKFFLAGYLRKDTYAKNTALLAGEALADAEIVSEVMKNVDRRLRPREIPPTGDFAHTWFKAGGGILINRGSFPSGHAIGAFAMATVIAERYRQHRWVPWRAYGLASAVGFSRITLSAHFPSDIFAGAILGYSISRYVVLHR